MKNPRPIQLLFIAFLFSTPVAPSKVDSIFPKKLENPNSSLQTDFNITDATTTFQIFSNGEYSCNFILRVVGNAHTSQGGLSGLFRIESKEISDFSLRFQGTSVNCTVSSIGNDSVCEFTITQGLLPGIGYEFLGSFQANYYQNISGIYTYHLGIDWGALVGKQETCVRLDDRIYALILPNDPAPHLSINHPPHQPSYITELNWIDSFVTKFRLDFSLLVKTSPNIYLQTSIESWNASVGQNTDVTLTNAGPFAIHGWVITPIWMTNNVTKFTILPDQELAFRLKVSSKATVGMNGTVEIVTEEFLEIINISVFVTKKESPSSFHNDWFLLFAIFSIMGTSGIIGLGFHQRNNISGIIQRLKKQEGDSFGEEASSNLDTSLTASNGTITELAEYNWKSVQSRFQNVLPENELRVVEILFHQGSMNQQAIADQLDISKMTMSRIISRLETKQLLFRERSGMSNIIKLNEKQFSPK